jgi:hypothetical protein
MARGSVRSVTEGADYLHPTELLNEGDLPVEARRVEWPRALDLLPACHATTAVPAKVGVRRETIWRWTQDPGFAAEVSRRQVERSQAIHSEVDAGVREAVQMLRGLGAGP